MSYESQALAPDELSLLDLFGPDTSLRAQNIVKVAAERSMDEMAAIINESDKNSSEKEFVVSVSPTTPDLPFPGSITWFSLPDDLDDVLHGEVLEPLAPHRATEALFPREWSLQIPEYSGKHPIVRITSITDELSKLSDDMRQSVEKLMQQVNPQNVAAKASIVEQLSRQLAFAMAQGMDLTKASVALNLQNPTTGRIEPINIYAKVSDERALQLPIPVRKRDYSPFRRKTITKHKF